MEEYRTPEEMASQQINASNPGRLEMQIASRGGVNSFHDAAVALNNQIDAADNQDFVQLMYEQGSEQDRVDRISRERGLR